MRSFGALDTSPEVPGSGWVPFIEAGHANAVTTAQYDRLGERANRRAVQSLEILEAPG
jgi:hypothetical protein